MYFLEHYLIRDLQRRLGLLKWGITIFRVSWMSENNPTLVMTWTPGNTQSWHVPWMMDSIMIWSGSTIIILIYNYVWWSYIICNIILSTFWRCSFCLPFILLRYTNTNVDQYTNSLLFISSLTLHEMWTLHLS